MIVFVVALLCSDAKAADANVDFFARFVGATYSEGVRDVFVTEIAMVVVPKVVGSSYMIVLP